MTSGCGNSSKSQADFKVTYKGVEVHKSWPYTDSYPSSETFVYPVNGDYFSLTVFAQSVVENGSEFGDVEIKNVGSFSVKVIQYILQPIPMNTLISEGIIKPGAKIKLSVRRDGDGNPYCMYSIDPGEYKFDDGVFLFPGQKKFNGFISFYPSVSG